MGWDIPRYLKEKDLEDGSVLATYVCHKCGDYFIQPYSGEDKDCSSCGSKKSVKTKNSGKGVGEKELNEIYNLMDVYCHPFTSGGQELPIQEAKAAGLITLVTLRHNRKALENELNFLGISSWFTSVLSSDEGQNEISRHSIKTQMIRAHFKSDVNGWFVGDTETDLRAGKDLGLYCVATSFGIRTREILSRESPNQIISCPRDFVIWLKSIENESSFLRSKSTVSFP